MFVARKLKKLRGFASKELARTEKTVRQAPSFFSEDALRRIEQSASALRKSMGNEDPEEIRTRLRDYKRSVDESVPFYKTSFVREYVEAIVIAAILALFIRSFIIQAFKIPSGYMIPTLLVGDHIVVNKFIYGLKIPFVKDKVLPLTHPKRGDIVVFQFPGDPSKDFIKRVIGLPGDRIEILPNGLRVDGHDILRKPVGKYRYEDTGELPVESNLYLEDLEGVEHDVLQDVAEPGLIAGIPVSPNPIVVPEGKYFMMGDNRDRSNDSRYWGFVDFNMIRGKAMVIYFSWPPRQLLRFGRVVR